VARLTRPQWFLPLAALVILIASSLYGQLMPTGNIVIARLSDGSGNTITSTSSALDVNIKSGSIANTSFTIGAGTANIGFVRMLPSSCSQSTSFTNTTGQVATGGGTTVTSTTTCVTFAYANNITNSAVTLRLADKQGTPVIWLGGNADFSLPANSAVKIPIEGVTFTSGITAIAGTGSAINLLINGMQ